MSDQLQLVLVGGLFALSGAVIGALLTRLFQFWLEGIRERHRLQQEAMRTALEWAERGRKGTLRRLDLRDAHLGGVDLGPGEGREEGADLSYSDLRKADLRGARLEKANLAGANLAQANLVGASLVEADLRDAILERASLWGANLQGAILWRANLKKASLQELNLQQADLQGANLEGADFAGANLRGANLWRANLRATNLEGANLQGVNAGKLEWDAKTKWPTGFTPPAEIANNS